MPIRLTEQQEIGAYRIGGECRALLVGMVCLLDVLRHNETATVLRNGDGRCL